MVKIKNVLMLSVVPDSYFGVTNWLKNEDLSDFNFFLVIPEYFRNSYAKNIKNVKYFFLSEWNDKTILDESYKINQFSKIDMVFSFNEFEVERAAMIRKKLSIKKGQSIEAAANFRDKAVMKKKLINGTNYTVPNFKKIESKIDIYKFLENNSFPVVLKPTNSSGSVGIEVLEDKNAIEKLDIGNSKSNFMIEEYIDAPLYHIDGLLSKKNMVFMMISKYLYGDNLSYRKGKSTGSVEIDRNSKLTKRIQIAVYEILEKLTENESILFHMELFVKKNEIIFNEVGARIGGGRILSVISKKYGINPIEKLLRIELDIDVPRKITARNKKIHGWIMISPQKGMISKIPDTYDNRNVFDYYKYAKIGKIYNSTFTSATAVVGIAVSCYTTLEAKKNLIKIEHRLKKQITFQNIL